MVAAEVTDLGRRSLVRRSLEELLALPPTAAITTQELAVLADCSVQTIYNKIHEGQGPERMKGSGRGTKYRVSHARAWINAQIKVEKAFS